LFHRSSWGHEARYPNRVRVASRREWGGVR
jgi:hypothetical protein